MPRVGAACPRCALPSSERRSLRRVPRDSRRRMRRRSPRGATRFRPIACCRRSSTARSWRSPSRWRSRSPTPSPRAARRCRTGIVALPLAGGTAARSAGSTTRRRSRAASRRARACRCRRPAPRPRFAAAGRARRGPHARATFAARSMRGDATRRSRRRDRRRRDDDRRDAGGGGRTRARAPARGASRRGSCARTLPPSRRSATDAGSTHRHVRRRPRPSRDPAQHRQRHPADGEHGNRAAPRRAAGLPDGRPRPAPRRPRLPRVRARRRAPRFRRVPRGARRGRAAPLVRVHDAGEPLGVRRRATRPATCWRSDAKRADCPPPWSRSFPPTRAAHPDAPRRAQPQPVERRRRRRLRSVAASRIQKSGSEDRKRR